MEHSTSSTGSSTLAAKATRSPHARDATLEPIHLSTHCRYPSKRCWNPRTLTRSGATHRFCEFHRARANANQRRVDQRRRDKRQQRANAIAQSLAEPSPSPPPPPQLQPSPHPPPSSSPPPPPPPSASLLLRPRMNEPPRFIPETNSGSLI